MQSPTKPIALIVLDGVGIAHDSPGNAVTKALTPFLERAWDSYPHTMLHASGEHVGLPAGVKGNSEVGHMNLGSGRVVFQELPRINKTIDNGAFYKNAKLLEALFYTQHNNSRLHAAVCFSDAGVHGTIKHLEALLQTAKQQNFTQPLIIHAFTDGRDTPPKSAATYFTVLQSTIDKLGVGTFGSVIGRYYSMDRNLVWDRVERAYDALTRGEGNTVSSWKEAIDAAYDRGETDEFIAPTLIKNKTIPDPTVHDRDAWIFLNYRADRAIELTSALTLKDFPYFERKRIPNELHFVGMTEYQKGIPVNVAFPTEDLNLTLGRVLAENDQRQLRIAESEKFPHVTYFFNGGRASKFFGEDRIEIPSLQIATYDKQPEMSLPTVTQTLINQISNRIYDFILVNFANGDMVGHTGVMDAGIAAMQYVDKSVEKVVSAVRSVGGATIITADHGNVEEMLNEKTGGIDTEHSMNPVPFVFIPPQQRGTQIKLERGALSDVAPTILSLMNISRPSEMKGNDLIG